MSGDELPPGGSGASDEPDGTAPRDRGRLPSGASMALAAVVAGLVAVAGVHRSGIGGLRNGPLLAAGIVAAAVGLAAALPSRRLPEVGALWLAAAVAVGALAGVVVARRAPLSTDRLTRALDELRLPGAVIEERRTGNVRCDPCPEVRRLLRVDRPRTAAATAVVGSLRAAELRFSRARAGEVAEDVFAATATSDRYRIRYEVEPVAGPPTRVRVIATSR